MSSGLPFALGAMLCFGCGDLIYKRGASAGARPHHFLMVQSWVFAPSVVLYTVLTGAFRFVPGSFWGALAGVFILLGFYNFAHSLRAGSISTNAPVFRLSFVLTAILAIVFLRESVSGYKVLGITLALAAAWLLLGAPAAKSAPGPQTDRSGLARVIFATASVGIGNFLHTLGLRAGSTPGSLIVAQATVVVTLATVFAAVRDRRIQPSDPALRYAPRAAVVLVLAFVFMVESMARGEASVAVPIAQMGFVVTALLGFIFLREPFTLRKAAGILTALGALASLALA